eukprot:240721-Hanusia_phi.AAC.1
MRLAGLHARRLERAGALTWKLTGEYMLKRLQDALTDISNSAYEKLKKISSGAVDRLGTTRSAVSLGANDLGKFRYVTCPLMEVDANGGGYREEQLNALRKSLSQMGTN